MFQSYLCCTVGANEAECEQTRLSELVEPLRRDVSENISKQEKMLDGMQSTNMQFQQARGELLGRGRQEAGQAAQESTRAAFLQTLASGADTFVEILGNLREGTKFYGDFMQVILKYQQKVQDYCFARKTEKEELMQDLVSSVAGGVGGQTPAPPQPAPVKPPARPPPPAATRTTQVPVAPTPGAPPAMAGAPPGMAVPPPIPPPPPGMAPGMPPGAPPMPPYGAVPYGYPPYGYPAYSYPFPGYGYPTPGVTQPMPGAPYPYAAAPYPYPGAGVPPPMPGQPPHWPPPAQ